MSATITISQIEIRQVFQQRAFAGASRFAELAQKANSLAAIIENHWEKIPLETQKLIKVFAYALIEPPQGIKQRFIEFLGRFHLAVVLFGMAIQGEIDSFVACHNAFDRLVSAILNAVEREDKAYQQALSEALEGLLPVGNQQGDDCLRSVRASQANFRTGCWQTLRECCKTKPRSPHTESSIHPHSEQSQCTGGVSYWG